MVDILPATIEEYHLQDVHSDSDVQTSFTVASRLLMDLPSLKAERLPIFKDLIHCTSIKRSLKAPCQTVGVTFHKWLNDPNYLDSNNEFEGSEDEV